MLETVNEDKIRPAPPSFNKKEPLHLLQEVDFFHENSWCNGKITCIYDDDHYSVTMKDTTEVLQIHSDSLRIHQEWVNGNWECPLVNEGNESEDQHPEKEGHHETKKGKGKLVCDDENDQPAKKGKMDTNVFLRRSRHEVKGGPTTKTPFKAPKNPALHRTPKEINAALLIFAIKREAEAPYFHNNRFPRVTFCSTLFFGALDSCYQKFKNVKKSKDIQYLFTDPVIQVVKWTNPPAKNWNTEVDVI